VSTQFWFMLREPALRELAAGKVPRQARREATAILRRHDREMAKAVRQVHRTNLEQLVREALVLVDPTHADYERLDVRDWLRAARQALDPRCATR